MNRFLQHLAPGSLAIFLFHGVTDGHPYQVRNYTGKHLNHDFFRGLVLALKAHGTPLSMDDIITLHQTGTPYPPRAFAITFDDGFANNYTVAAPILEALGIPATIYVTTGWIGTNRMSWIDRLEHCLEIAPRGRVRLPWRADASGFSTTADKIRLLDEIRFHAKREPHLDLDGFVADVFAQCGQTPIDRNDGPLDRKLSWSQVAELRRHPLFTIGGHTHSHAILAYLDDAALDREIETSLSLLREQAAVPTRHYSYPEGTAFSFDDRVIAALRRRGVVCCPAVLDDVNHGTESLFHLKRITVG